ncbi:phosphorylase family protein [Fusarium tricinctum]|uniref:Phosphorylase family protein n=1 Tax=Fusarium tricinctum TaxID=61284 RepID=A0A8K0RY70_9HYPO|nr:phosphorylase family protein [Fusarium tricinctum]
MSSTAEAEGNVEASASVSVSVSASELKRDNGLQSRCFCSQRNRVDDTPESNPAVAAEEYTVGWVYALPLEMAAAKGMFDRVHPNLPQQNSADHNNYILGQVGQHEVVIACLPAGIYGTTTAATVAKDFMRTFQSIRFGLMVGIGGGVPSPTHDIRLGDVVVGQPTGVYGGVVQYDRDATCAQYDHEQTVHRETRDDTDSEIHYGAIASGNQVIKHGETRDRLSKELGSLCFEMEAAGLQNFPCLVIRGISDYADSHKNNMWQGYAAATATAFAKELLFIISPVRVLQEKPVPQLVSIAKEQLQVSAQHLEVSTDSLAEHRRTKYEVCS